MKLWSRLYLTKKQPVAVAKTPSAASCTEKLATMMCSSADTSSDMLANANRAHRTTYVALVVIRSSDEKVSEGRRMGRG